MSVSLATIATGDVVTAARLNNAPQGLLTIASSTSNASATSGTTEMDVLTASAVTVNASNRRLKLTWHCSGISATVAAGTDIFTVAIKEGSTTFNESNYVPVVTGVGATGGCDFSAYIDSPSTGAHTYKVTIRRAVGSGAATVRGSVNAPMYLTVEDVGISP